MKADSQLALNLVHENIYQGARIIRWPAVECLGEPKGGAEFNKVRRGEVLESSEREKG